jgi:hypothetical protein
MSFMQNSISYRPHRTTKLAEECLIDVDYMAICAFMSHGI